MGVAPVSMCLFLVQLLIFGGRLMSSAPQVLAPRARSSATPHSPSRCGRPCPRAAATHNTECCTGNVTLGLRLSSALLVFLDGVLGFFLLPARRPPAGWWWLQKKTLHPAPADDRRATTTTTTTALQYETEYGAACRMHITRWF